MSKHGLIAIAAAAIALGLASSASAGVRGPVADGGAPEENAEPEPQAEPLAPEAWPARDVGQPAPAARWTPGTGVGVSVTAGGGVTDFTHGAARDATGTGGSWDVRVAVGTRRWLGGELSYVGGLNSLDNVLGSSTSTSTQLTRNGLEGAVRLNAPLYVGNTLLEPYVLGGVGWSAFRVTNFNALSADVDIDGNGSNVMTVPAGIGFAMGYKGLIGDIRGTYRPTFMQTLFPNQSGTVLTNWDVGGMLGYEF
jgi:hypothetical protein